MKKIILAATVMTLLCPSVFASQGRNTAVKKEVWPERLPRYNISCKQIKAEEICTYSRLQPKIIKNKNVCRMDELKRTRTYNEDNVIAKTKKVVIRSTIYPYMCKLIGRNLFLNKKPLAGLKK